MNKEITVVEAVARVKETTGDEITRQTIVARIKAKTLKARKIGRMYLVDQDSLDNWKPKASGRPKKNKRNHAINGNIHHG